jgi:hypothetical protein
MQAICLWTWCFWVGCRRRAVAGFSLLEEKGLFLRILRVLRAKIFSETLNGLIFVTDHFKTEPLGVESNHPLRGA